ncbi:GL16578 [Drosophila persimilis]|uniref:GL16578 n=1 Tax=Drosophila persimilis TaxID=7234 RepID=B4GWN0_DROPE|nr:GL16578 [Drosophila persimilis]
MGDGEGDGEDDGEGEGEQEVHFDLFDGAQISQRFTGCPSAAHSHDSSAVLLSRQGGVPSAAAATRDRLRICWFTRTRINVSNQTLAYSFETQLYLRQIGPDLEKDQLSQDREDPDCRTASQNLDFENEADFWANLMM